MSIDPKHPLTRRAALRAAATAGAGVLLNAPGTSQDTGIQVAGRPVEISITTISPETVRISAQPIQNGTVVPPIPVDGALVQESWGAPVARLRTLEAARTVKSGDLTVQLSPNPLTIRIQAKDGRLIQELRPDPATGILSFEIGDAPVLCLGQGGPQF